MLESLPREIQMDIMLRMPTETLVKLACTSKTHYLCITGPTFKTAHLKKSKENPFILFGYQRGWEAHFETFHHDAIDFQRDSKYKSFELPREFAYANSSNLVGCCNGVLCLVDHFNHFIFLWNPSLV